MDRRERRLARDEEQLALLLERHRGRPVHEVCHRPGGDARRSRHRTGADNVPVHPRRAARVRRRVVAEPDDGDAVEPVHEPCRHFLARQREVAVELGREDLDAGVGDADADLGPGGGERLQEPSRIRSARGACDAEEDVTAPRAANGRRRPGLDSSRKVPSRARCSSPRLANAGMTVFRTAPGWPRTPRLLGGHPEAPISDRSGAPRFLEPRRGTCGSACSPTRRRGCALGALLGEALRLRPLPDELDALEASASWRSRPCT